MSIEEIEFLGEMADLVETRAKRASGFNSRDALFAVSKWIRKIGVPHLYFDSSDIDSLKQPNSATVTWVRIVGQDLPASDCCDSPQILVPKTKNFVVLECSKCKKAAPLFRRTFEHMSQRWVVSCWNCRRRMEASEYAFHCKACELTIGLADLLTSQ